MNTRESKNTLPGTEQVSSAYRAANFDEEPPAELDRAILLAANRRRRRPLASYLPSLAFAAAVVLSVSLVLTSGVLNENTEIFSDEEADAPGISAFPASTLRELDEFVAPASPERAPLGAAANTAATVQTICNNTDREEPVAWLSCISALLEEGNEDEARRELVAFTQAYADYPLPADLDAEREP